MDSVAGKLTHMENRLLKLEWDAGAHRPADIAAFQGPADAEEPIFMGAQGRAKPKHRRLRQVASDS